MKRALRRIMKYLLLSFIFVGCSSTLGPELTLKPATKCSQLTGQERRACVQQYEANPTDYQEAVSE
jgi:hypothetical protein